MYVIKIEPPPTPHRCGVPGEFQRTDGTESQLGDVWKCQKCARYYILERHGYDRRWKLIAERKVNRMLARYGKKLQ